MATIRDVTQAYTAAGDTVTITTPTGATTGDILIAVVSSDIATGNITAGAAGWTEERDGDDSGAQLRMAVYSRVLAAAPDANYAFTNTDSVGNIMGVLYAVNPNGDTFEAVVAGTLNAVNTNATAATDAVTGVANPSVLLSVFAADDTTTVLTAPADMDLQEFVDGSSMDMAAYSQIDPGEGSLVRTIIWAGVTDTLCVSVLLDFASSGPSPMALVGTMIGPDFGMIGSS